MDKVYILLRWLVALPLWAILSAMLAGAAIAIYSFWLSILVRCSNRPVGGRFAELANFSPAGFAIDT